MIHASLVCVTCDSCGKTASIDTPQHLGKSPDAMLLPSGFLAMWRIALDRYYSGERRSLHHACSDECFSKLASDWLLAHGLNDPESPIHSVSRLIPSR